MAVELKDIAQKLLRCRENLQMSVYDVSRYLGLPPDYLTRIESGEHPISGDDILILADFYKEDFKYFITNNQLSSSEQIEILYRKYGNSFSVNDRIAIQEFVYLCECEQFIYNELGLNFSAFTYRKQGDFYKQHGEDSAQKLRHFLGYNEHRILEDVFNDFRKLGIHIFRRKLENSSISGLFIRHPYAGKCILVNYTEDIYRQNFTLAHEVGHAILDGDDEILNISFTSDKGFDLKEVRANTFASNFLIPPMAIKNLKIHNWNIQIIKSIASKLKVNITPLLFTLKNLKLITQTEFESFKNTYIDNKKDFELENLTEAQINSRKILLNKGLSSFYLRRCYEAYEKGIISEKRLAEVLLIEDSELPSILGLLNLRLDYSL